MSDESGPFRKSEAPAPTTAQFSPLRPFKLIRRWLMTRLWWWLNAKMWAATTWQDPKTMMPYEGGYPTWFGVFMVVIAFVTSLMALMIIVHNEWPPDAIGWVAGWGGATILRGWIRGAMHLDDPESWKAWQEKIG